MTKGKQYQNTYDKLKTLFSRVATFQLSTNMKGSLLMKLLMDITPEVQKNGYTNQP